MSIGKNSIARAASSAAPKKAPKKENENKAGVYSLIAVSDAKEFTQLKKGVKATAKLQASIKEYGILSPIIVAKTARGETWLIDGYARLDAAKKQKYETLPAVIFEVKTKTQAQKLFSELQIKEEKKAPVIKETKPAEKKQEKTSKSNEMPIYLL